MDIWQNSPELDINLEKYSGVRERVMEILLELNHLRHAHTLPPSWFPEKLLAQSIQKSAESVIQYIREKLSRDGLKITEFLGGQRRLYELLDVDVEQEFLELLGEDLDRAGNGITEILMKRYMLEAIQQFTVTE